MVPIITLLTKYPGCAGLRDAMGRTFLHVAVKKRHVRVVQFVCLRWRHSFKSMLNIQDNKGNTALHLAIMEGDVDIFRCLMRNKYVHINLQNKDGKTPMDLAHGKVQSGFYFGLTAHRRILEMLTLANALPANRRRDQLNEYYPCLSEKEESQKITDFAQIVGIEKSSPGSAPPPAGTPVFARRFAFDGFVISNTLAFICSTLATFSLVYCGVAAVHIRRRIKLVSFSLALLLCAARSFCAAFAFALYLLLAKVEMGTAIAACVMTSLALLDGAWFVMASFHDTTAVLSRRAPTTLLRLGTGFLVNILYLFWPYLVIFGLLATRNVLPGDYLP
ncbi:hypothetical protein EJB05_49839, partial [Eragrostis curvula]